MDGLLAQHSKILPCGPRVCVVYVSVCVCVRVCVHRFKCSQVWRTKYYRSFIIIVIKLLHSFNKILQSFNKILHSFNKILQIV